MPAQAGQPRGTGGPQGPGRPGGPEPEGHLLGMPYDWRTPTGAKVQARWWNPDDRRVFTPKAFGWGYDLNVYWLCHPVRYVTGKR